MEKVGVHTVLNHGINQTDSQSVSVYSGKNELVCYITGLSSVTAALVQVCAVYGVELTLMHYDRDTDEYVPQVIFSKTDGEFEMNIKETLVFENELNTLFNQEENNEKNTL